MKGLTRLVTVSSDDNPWWADAVVYQVYPRSFADSDDDGTGDLDGLRERLAYLADLGVDAIWLTPFYPSPLADGGYDVSDYTDVDPRLGTLAGFDSLVQTARRHDIRVIVDLVPNHCSAEHPLFKKALAAGPGSSERDMFIFREGRGPDVPSPRTTGRRTSAAPRGPGSPTASGTCTCSASSGSRTGTGATRGCRRCSRT